MTNTKKTKQILLVMLVYSFALIFTALILGDIPNSFKGLYKSDKYALKPRGVLAPKKNFVFILSLPFYNYITNNMQKFSKGE